MPPSRSIISILPIAAFGADEIKPTYHEVSVKVGPELTSEQRKQALLDTIAERDSLELQLVATIRDNEPEDQISAWRGTAAEYETMVLEMQYTPMFNDRLSATLADDPQRFLAPCDDGMRASITSETLAAVAECPVRC